MTNVFCRTLIGLFLGIIFLTPCQAAGLPSDSSQVTLRIPTEEKISELKADKDFSWLNTPEESYSWWGHFWSWLGQQINRLLQSGSGGNFWDILFSKILPWIVILTAASLAVIKLLGIEVDSILSKKPVSAGIAFRESTGELHEVDLGSRMEEALKKRDFRLAIRLYYLDILHQLSEKGLIQWHPEKTNGQYLREIGSQDIKKRFGRLTYLFDYTWYGEFNPLETHFEEAKREFLTLKGIITDH